MAIGDTVQAGLMRIDTSAYERAGQANANANMAFGNALNQVAKGFIEGQEKKARAEEMTGYLMNQGVSEKDAKAIAKNPFLQKEYQRKKATEAQMQMEGNRLQMEAQKLAAQQKQSSDQAFQKNREMDMKEELFRTQQDKNREAEESATNIAKFNLDRPELPITEETPAAFLPELDPDPFVGPPTTYQGQAPAVAQLPESFQPQGAQVVDAVQSGQLSPLEGNRIMDSIRGQAMAEQKAGPTRSEILAREKYEDEKATRESEKEILDTESTNNLTDFYNETSGLLDKINEKTVDVTGPIEGTSVYRFFSKIGDTDDEQVRRRLEMFTRKLTLDAAQNLKGALSDKDIRFLVEQAPDMDDNPSVWKKYMGDLKTRLERNATQKGINFEDTNSPQQSANTIDPSAPASQATLDALEKARQLRNNRIMMQQTLDNPNIPNYGSQ